MSRRASSLRLHLLVAGLYTALTLFMTWPLALRLNTHFAGSDIDVWINTWATWWTKKTIAEGGSLYFTDLLFYPHGVSLVFHSFSHFNSALELLFQPFLGSLGAYNTTILLTHVLSGYGVFCLVRHISGNVRAAFLAGLVFAFFPYRMYESAHPVIASTQWLPFYWLSLHHLLQERRGRHILSAALFFLLTALSSWHLMLFSGFLTLLYLAYTLVFERRNLCRTSLTHVALLFGLIGLVLAPLLYPMIHEQLTVSTPYMSVDSDIGRGNDLLAFVTPAQQHPLLGELFAPLRSEFASPRRDAYLGLTAVGLGVVGAVANWRRFRFWGLLAVTSLACSLGPILRVYGRPTGITIPGSELIIALVRHPFRFNLLIGLALAVSSGLGLAAALDWIRSRSQRASWLAAGLLALLLLFEYLYCPFPTTPAAVPAFYAGLSGQSGGGALLDLPMGRQRAKPYMYYQTVHGRPIVEGVVSRTPSDAYDFISATPALRSMRACGQHGLPPADLAPLLDDLAAEGIEYLVVHKMLPVREAAVDAWVRARELRPDYEDYQLAVYHTRRPLPPEPGRTQLLEDCIGVRSTSTDPAPVLPGKTLEVEVEWILGSSTGKAYTLELALASEAGEVVDRQQYEVLAGRSLASPELYAPHRASYSFPIDPLLPPGLYHLRAKLLPAGVSGDDLLSALVRDVQVSARRD